MDSDDLRELINIYEDRIDTEVEDPTVRQKLWQACDEARKWSWQNTTVAQEALAPVHTHFNPDD